MSDACRSVARIVRLIHRRNRRENALTYTHKYSGFSSDDQRNRVSKHRKQADVVPTAAKPHAPDGHFGPFRWLGNTDKHGNWQSLRLTFNNNHGSVYRQSFEIHDVSLSASKTFWPLLGPCGHDRDNRWVRLQAWGFLLVFCSNHI